MSPIRRSTRLQSKKMVRPCVSSSQKDTKTKEKGASSSAPLTNLGVSRRSKRIQQRLKYHDSSLDSPEDDKDEEEKDQDFNIPQDNTSERDIHDGYEEPSASEDEDEDEDEDQQNSPEGNTSERDIHDGDEESSASEVEDQQKVTACKKKQSIFQLNLCII